MVKYFCEECGYQLVENTASGQLSFDCNNCHEPYESTPDDSLLFDISFQTDNSEEKYATMTMNAPYDEAGYKVARECKKCAMPYMTRVYVGEEMTTVYVCVCGNREDNIVEVAKKK